MPKPTLLTTFIGFGAVLVLLMSGCTSGLAMEATPSIVIRATERPTTAAFLAPTDTSTPQSPTATSKISAAGVMGDPTKASVEKGKKIWEISIAHLVGLVEDLKNLSLEEIHHRKD